MSLDEMLKAGVTAADLLDMLKGTVWFSSSGYYNDTIPKNKYSMEVEPETCYRDVCYRNAPLFDTAEEAIFDFWKKHYGPQ